MNAQHPGRTSPPPSPDCLPSVQPVLRARSAVCSFGVRRLQHARSKARRFTTVAHAKSQPSKTSSAQVQIKWAEDTPLAPSTSVKKGTMGIAVNSHFDSGNIEVGEMSESSSSPGCHEISLRIHEDPFCDMEKHAHFQWFNFRVTGAKGVNLQLNLTNAGAASFPRAWSGYQACASYDRRHWFRAPTSYNAQTGVLTISHSPSHDAVQYAFFAPYTLERHSDMVAEVQMDDRVHVESLGCTLDGHELDLLRIGEPGPDKRKVWIVARQHPGESMAEFFVEGFLRRLLDPHDGLARKALREAVFYVVPNMNPDGTWRGHLRVNAAGANLNREWSAPTTERSPEVLFVRNKMDEVGVDFMADVHGDEELPYNFLAGSNGVPSWDERLAGLQARFKDSFLRVAPDFQTKYGYGVAPRGRGDLRKCTNYVAERFKCLAFTLEMPFKDTADTPEPLQGWSPERSLRFGAAMLGAVVETIPHLR